MAAAKPPCLLFGSLGRIYISRYGFHGHWKVVLNTIYAAPLFAGRPGRPATRRSNVVSFLKESELKSFILGNNIFFIEINIIWIL